MSDQDTFLSGIEILDTSPATSSSGSLYTFGGISILSTTNASASSASFLTLGGTFIQGNTIIGGNTQLLSTTIASNTTTGALTIAGGIGIQGNAYGNFANFSNIQATIGATIPNLVATNASIGSLSVSAFNPANITTNNLVVTIGTSIANAIFTNITTTNLALANNFSAQTVNVTGTTGSFSTSTGTIIISGGIGVNQHIFANRGFYGDTVNLTNNSRPLNLVDTRAAISCWRWVPPTGANSGNPAIEFIGGTGGSATAVGNNYGDIYMDDSAAIGFRNRTTGGTLITLWVGQTGNIGIGTSTPNFKLDTVGDARVTGNFTAGTSLFTPNATITSLTTGSAYFNSTTVSSNTGTGAVVITGGLGVGGAVNIGGNTVINGNLTVNGTTVSVNSTTVNINDNIIILNSGPSGVADGGLLISRYQITNNAGTGEIVSDTVAFSGTLQTGTSTSQIVLPSGASAVDSFYNNYWIKITSGTANNNVRQIVSYTGATKTAILNSVLTATPTANTDTVNLYGNVYIANYYKESTNEYTISYTNSTPGSTITDTNYANLRVANLTGNLVSASNLVVTNATITNFTLPTNVTFSNLVSTNSTLTNLLATNNTLTNLISNFNTLSNLLSTSSTISTLLNTNLIGTNHTITNLISNFNTLSNLLSTSSTISTLLNTNFIGTNQTVTNIVATNFTTASLTTTNLNLTNFTTVNSRITSETIGSILATNINTTNFTVSSLNVTSLTSSNAFFTNLTTTNLISTTNANMAGITLQYFTGSPAGSWINMPIGTGFATGMGHGGPGASPWIAYAGSPGYWFTNSLEGDICYRNLTGNLNFGNSTGLSTMQINNNTVTINSTIEALNSTTASLIVNGGLVVNKSIDINSTTIATNTSTGALIVSGGAGFNGDIYAKNLYSNGVLVGGSNIWGTEYNFAFNGATAGTTSNAFQLRLSLTTGNLLGGTYHIHTGFSMFSSSVTNQNSEFRALLDATNTSTGTLLAQAIFRPINTAQIQPFYKVTTTTIGSGIHTLSIIYRNQNNGSVTNIDNTKLELFRIF
jgi:hypothetical protein